MFYKNFNEFGFIMTAVVHDTVISIRNEAESGSVKKTLELVDNLFKSSQTVPEEIYQITSNLVLNLINKDTNNLVNEDTPKSFQNINAVYKELITQSKSDAKKHFFVTALTDRLTSGLSFILPIIATEIEPVLTDLIDGKHIGKNLVLTLLIVRKYLNTISEKHISELHHKYFSKFTTQDLTHPYSTMFGDGLQALQANIADLTYFTSSEKILSQLPPSHVLLLCWTESLKLTSINEHLLIDIIKKSYTKPSSHQVSQDNLSAITTLLLYYRHDIKNAFSLIPSDISKELTVLLSANDSSLNSFHNETILEKIQTRRYQHVTALTNLLSAKVKIPNHIFKKKPKIAICISGQLRGFERVFPQWKKHLLRGVEYDIFIHSWQNIGSSGAEPFRKKLPFENKKFQIEYRNCCKALGFEMVKAQYPNLFKELYNTGKTSSTELENFYGAIKVVLENDTSSYFKNMPNSEKMHYKINAAYELIEDPEHYDLILRIRPDLPISFLGYKWHDLIQACQQNNVIFTENAMGLHYMNLMIGDQIAIGSPGTMKVYSETWRNHPYYTGAIYNSDNEYKGHKSLANICWMNKIRVLKLPVKKGSLQDQAPLGTAKIRSSILLDSSNRNSSWDEILLSSLD
jgi:hypothetical protein